MQSLPLLPTPVIKFLEQTAEDVYLVSVTAPIIQKGKIWIEIKIGESSEWEVCPASPSLCLPCDCVSFFRSVTVTDKLPRYSQVLSKGPVHNVLLIGPSGVGKSKFANYLSTLGQSAPFKVAPPGLTLSCTQTIHAHTVEVETTGTTMLLRLIDTPGLNEADPAKDLAHMLRLVKFVSGREIACILLCLRWHFKEDTQTLETVKYYKKLLKSVFVAGNVFLVLTNFSQEAHDEIEEDGGDIYLARNKKT